MSGYVYFTDDQKQRANAVDLEDFLVRQGERLLRSGREKRLDSDHSITVRGMNGMIMPPGRAVLPLTLCRCSMAEASRMQLPCC